MQDLKRNRQRLQDSRAVKSRTMYDLTWLMPEHPIDETNYIRDTGNHPVINGQVGIFFKAFLGYSEDPSLGGVYRLLGILYFRVYPD